MVQEGRTFGKKVETIVKKYGSRRDSLISILQDIQAAYNYLPEAALRQVAIALNIPAVQVFGVATFFRAFSLKPRGKHQVTVCLGTACHVRGAQKVVEEVERQLGVKPGETTADGKYTLETVNCVGACALGPILILDGVYHGQMGPGRVKEVLSSEQATRRGLLAGAKRAPDRRRQRRRNKAASFDKRSYSPGKKYGKTKDKRSSRKA